MCRLTELNLFFCNVSQDYLTLFRAITSDSRGCGSLRDRTKNSSLFYDQKRAKIMKIFSCPHKDKELYRFSNFVDNWSLAKVE